MGGVTCDVSERSEMEEGDETSVGFFVVSRGIFGNRTKTSWKLPDWSFLLWPFSSFNLCLSVLRQVAV